MYVFAVSVMTCPIVASLPETSVPLAIERIEREIKDVKFDADE